MNRNSTLPSLPTLLLGVALIALVVFGGVAASRFLNTPLAEPLSVQTAPEAGAAQPEAAAQEDIAVQPESAAQPEAAVKQAGICGESGSMTLLFTGADFSGGVPPRGADAVRVVKVDFDKQTINIVAFPRDLWLKVDGLKEQDKPQERLGLAYHYMKEATTGSDREKITAGTNLLAQVLYDNFAVQPDHFFTLQLDSVQEMVDTIGGVDINLPEAITTEHDVAFPAGAQTLDGRLSTEFLRAYQPGGEPARLERQNLFVKALRAKVLSAGVIAKVPELIEQFNEAIVTDLTPAQLGNLACAMEKIPAESTKFYEIEGDMVIEQEDGALQPVMDKIKQMLDEAMGTKQK